MLAMATVLCAPTLRAATAAPGSVLSVYADDRAAAARTAEGIQRIESVWARLEELTSMRSNTDKQDDFVVRSARPRGQQRKKQRAETLGRTEEKGRAQVKLLGVDILLGKGTVLSEREQGKIEELRRRAARVRKLGLPCQKRHVLVTSSCVPALTWSFVNEDDTLVFKSAESNFGREFGVAADIGTREYLLREAWRRGLWAAFLGAKRRDSSMARQAVARYCHRANKAANDLIAEKGGAGFACILTGDYWSDLRLAKAKGQPERPCSRCNTGALPSADHDFWACPLWRPWRVGLEVPRDPFTRRTGWPVQPLRNEAETDELKRRMAFMASVRAA
ncbi:unnamed protein product, partial [Prorocentrum cordatum]